MLLCRKQNVGINLWREGGLVFLLVTRPLTSSNSGIATHPLLAKASVIWIVLFREGDFKREGRLSWSQERRKAALAGSPTVFGPFFTTTERCQAPPHNCYACVLAQSFRERHFANVRYLFIYLFFWGLTAGVDVWLWNRDQPPRGCELLVLCPQFLVLES